MMIARLNSFLAIVAALCMGAMMTLTLADALGRYLLHAPVPGAIDYISFCLAFLVYAALPIATLNRRHITVGILAEILPAWYGRAERVFSDVATVLCCAFLAWITARQGLRYAYSEFASQATDTPLAPLLYGLAILAAIGVIFAIAATLKGASGTQGHGFGGAPEQ